MRELQRDFEINLSKVVLTIDDVEKIEHLIVAAALRFTASTERFEISAAGELEDMATATKLGSLAKLRIVGADPESDRRIYVRIDEFVDTSVSVYPPTLELVGLAHQVREHLESRTRRIVRVVQWARRLVRPVGFVCAAFLFWKERVYEALVLMLVGMIFEVVLWTISMRIPSRIRLSRRDVAVPFLERHHDRIVNLVVALLSSLVTAYVTKYL